MEIKHFKGGWEHYLIPEGTYVAKVEIMSHRTDSSLWGIQFFGSDGAVLLAVGSINKPDWRKDYKMAITLLTLQEGERIVGVKSHVG